MPEESRNPASRPERPRWLGYAQLGLIVLVIAVALYLARAPARIDLEAATESRPGGTAVNVVRPVSTGHALAVDLTGTVSLEANVTVVSEVVGRVAWVSPDFRTGGSIRAGEPFIRIDPAEFELESQAARMAVREAEAGVLVETALAAAAARSFERENPGAEVPNGVRNPPSVAAAEAALEKRRASLALAELRLARTNISLPWDGRVAAAKLEAGAFVGPFHAAGEDSRLGVVYRPSALQVRVPVEKAVLDDLAPAIGRSASVRTDAGTHEATVARVSARVASRTRLATLFLEFPEDSPPDSLPVPGMFAEVEIAGPALADVYVLPESAAREHGGVWVVRDGVLSAATPATVGRSADGWIVEAFDAGDGVVAGPLPGARDGLEVRIEAAPSE